MTYVPTYGIIDTQRGAENTAPERIDMIRSTKTAEAELKRKKPILFNWSPVLIDKYMSDLENRKIAVEYNGDNLRCIPGEYADSELCARALLAPNSWAALAVPNDAWTEKMARIAVSRNDKIMQHIPERIRTFDWCCAIIRTHPLCIRWIPDDFIREIAVRGAKNYDVLPLEELWQPIGPGFPANRGKRTEEYEALVKEISL